MIIEKYKGLEPKIHPSAKVFKNAVIAGDVTLMDKVNVWYNATIRADMAPVYIDSETNIQDNAVIHTNIGLPTFIGKNVTVGHGAIIHAATVKDNSLIGMGSIILDGAIISENCLIGAGAVIPPNKIIPKGSLVVGNPMRIVRELTDEEIDKIQDTEHYKLAIAIHEKLHPIVELIEDVDLDLYDNVKSCFNKMMI